ncbi:MAG: hypothetical protein HY243_06125 [Proteobacteria bacterium]|nr:hypothetical protein [Pseudomonadota bacterium]
MKGARASLGLTALAIFVASCSHGLYPDPPVDTQALGRADEEFVACLRAAARKMDDHVSSVPDIARGIQAVCEPQWENSQQVRAQGTDVLAQEMSRQDRAGHELEISTAVVLDERAKR